MTQESPSGVTAGRLLRQAREGAGLHVVALAATLKVPVRKLEALEADRYESLPDATFARALALSVCRQLKVDPTDILALLPQSGQVRLGEIPSLNTPFKSTEAAVTQKGGELSSVPQPVVFAVTVLLLAAVVWFAVPARDPSAAKVSAVAVAPATDATAAPVAEPVMPPTAAPGTEAGVTTAPAEPREGTAPEATAPAAAPALASAPAAGSAPTPAAPALPVDGMLQIRASEVSWVEVVGASGGVLLQRELGGGETVGFTTDAPFKVVVGRADATQVRVRGKALDISGYARNNVARFEVK